MENTLQTISWDNSNIYQNFQDPQILKDLLNSEQDIAALKLKVSIFEELLPEVETKPLTELCETIPLAREAYRLGLDVSVQLMTLATYGHTASTVNSLNYDAKDLANKSTRLFSQLNKTLKPLQLFLQRAPSAYLDQFLDDPRVDEMAFSLRYVSSQKDFLLSVSEEVLLEGLSVDGLQAWGKLYSDIAGAMKVSINEKEIGLAEASNILFTENRNDREMAYRSINKAWQQNELSAAAILNSINGWRLETNQTRSKKRELHYLDDSCHKQKISRTTLDTLMQTTFEHRHIGHQALRLMAQEMRVEKLGPWDLLAAYPAKTGGSPISFPEAMEIVIHSFGSFSSDMADFAKHAYDKRWIDATPTANRGSGAYCTGFAATREPRVFVTYDGSMKNVITLAHELGHAYHSWVMKDLKLGQTHYPSTLAETASIFAETLVRETILAKAKTNEEKKTILWQELDSASGLLVNIPARFEFERQFVDLRKTKTLSVPEIKSLNIKAWQHWYGDTLSEYNEMFWASKLHFSMATRSFYNYPYLFGYLFSLGIYAKKETGGENFKRLYLDILKDTGSMTAEDLILKHFNEDISKKDFWVKSLQIVEKSVTAFKNLQS